MEPGWLGLGVALHVGGQVARGCGWCAVVRAAAGREQPLRRRDAVTAWIAGAGAAGVLTARVGDGLRMLLLARRLPAAGYGLLAGTLVAESAGELALGTLVMAAALAAGVGPRAGAVAPLLAVLAAAALLAPLAVRLLRRSARARAAVCGVRRGCAPLSRPGAFARQVVPWQLTGRALRLSAIGCFLAAFGLPVSVTAILLVVAAQGSGHLLPFGPAAVGAGAAVLSATFGAVTGTPVPAGRAAAFMIGTSTVLTVVGIVLATLITLFQADWRAVIALVRPSRRVPARATT